ncbi:tRNA 2'-phosphotransferase 1-like isoform X2 [Bolinopsis microptera]|uniref:tRNA 2'-phosphotransferase 1-like isoform X2 n=1 Tax=Bolinopsis microptera TaxID=2820187 RepID=UPI00307ADA25
MCAKKDQVPSRDSRGRGKPRSSRIVEDTYQTPPGSSSNNRVQDSHWSPGSGVLSDNIHTSPLSDSGTSSPAGRAGRAGRYSSPLNRAGRHSSPSNRGRYTGKPRSSNSSPITREVKISKALSGICRHKHGTETLMMLEGGYFSVEEILNTSRFKQLSVTQAEVEDIVKSNDKQRFSLKELEGNLLICANQGHSFEVQGLELERIESADGYTGIVHGTYDAAWESIRRKGLSKMNRTHIHFAVGLPSNRQVISGMRGDCQVVIYIDMSAAIKDGLQFYKSKNNVILCSGNEDGLLPTKYFTSVIRIKGQRQLLHETRPVGFDPEQSASCHGNNPGTSNSEADRSNNWRKTA